MLCMVYFRCLFEVSGQYLDACSALYQVIVRSYNPFDERPLGQQVANNQDYKDARDALVDVIDEFHRQIAIHSETYAKS